MAPRFSDAQRACWAALSLLLDFQHREMDVSKPARGEMLAQDAEQLEKCVRTSDILSATKLMP